MKTATARDLRQKTAALLREVRRGGEVTITHRGKSIAVLVPAQKAGPVAFKPFGFGMWKDHKDLRSVDKWIESLRKLRHRR